MNQSRAANAGYDPQHGAYVCHQVEMTSLTKCIRRSCDVLSMSGKGHQINWPESELGLQNSVHRTRHIWFLNLPVSFVFDGASTPKQSYPSLSCFLSTQTKYVLVTLTTGNPTAPTSVWGIHEHLLLASCAFFAQPSRAVTKRPLTEGFRFQKIQNRHADLCDLDLLLQSSQHYSPPQASPGRSVSYILGGNVWRGRKW